MTAVPSCRFTEGHSQGEVYGQGHGEGQGQGQGQPAKLQNASWSVLGFGAVVVVLSRSLSPTAQAETGEAYCV